MIGDHTVYGVDYGHGKDESVLIIAKQPGKIRRWLRKHHIDRSKWELKIIWSGSPDG